MIYTLTLNPAVDYNVYLEAFKEGSLNLAKNTDVRPGGKGINVSWVLANLGVESIAMGFTGGFTGSFIKEVLNTKGIKSDFVELEGLTRINVKIKDLGIETEIAGIAPIVKDDNKNELIGLIKKLKTGDFLIMSGSVPDSLQNDIYKEVSLSLKEGIRIVLDTRGDILKTNLNDNFLIKPNLEELESMAGSKLATISDIIKFCSYFLDNNIKNVIVSMGRDGAVYIGKDCAYSASVPAGKLINSVGAGDSMVAGFLAGVSFDMEPQDCFKLAVAAGSATAYSYSLATKEHIYKLYDEIIITREV